MDAMTYELERPRREGHACGQFDCTDTTCPCAHHAMVAPANQYGPAGESMSINCSNDGLWEK